MEILEQSVPFLSLLLVILLLYFIWRRVFGHLRKEKSDDEECLPKSIFDLESSISESESHLLYNNQLQNQQRKYISSSSSVTSSSSDTYNLRQRFSNNGNNIYNYNYNNEHNQVNHLPRPIMDPNDNLNVNNNDIMKNNNHHHYNQQHPNPNVNAFQNRNNQRNNHHHNNKLNPQLGQGNVRGNMENMGQVSFINPRAFPNANPNGNGNMINKIHNNMNIKGDITPHNGGMIGVGGNNMSPLPLPHQPVHQPPKHQINQIHQQRSVPVSVPVQPIEMLPPFPQQQQLQQQPNGGVPRPGHFHLHQQHNQPRGMGFATPMNNHHGNSPSRLNTQGSGGISDGTGVGLRGSNAVAMKMGPPPPRLLAVPVPLPMHANVNVNRPKGDATSTPTGTTPGNSNIIDVDITRFGEGRRDASPVDISRARSNPHTPSDHDVSTSTGSGSNGKKSDDNGKSRSYSGSSDGKNSNQAREKSKEKEKDLSPTLVTKGYTKSNNNNNNNNYNNNNNNNYNNNNSNNNSNGNKNKNSKGLKIEKEASPQSVIRDSGLPLVHLVDLQMDYVLGGGAFGQVWRGTWRGTPVAVKILANNGQHDLPVSEIKGFEEEMKILAKLRHPNICLFMAACLEAPIRAIVTEVVSRGSVWDVLRDRDVFSDHRTSQSQQQEEYSRFHANLVNGNGPHQGNYYQGKSLLAHWPWWSVKRVLDGTLRGLVYLHSNNPPIIHRDLKSANLLLDDSFNVKICDFGLARLRSVNIAMTAKVGTIQWMAPEVLQGLEYNESADIYSTAIIAWELLTGKCPFSGSNQVDVALKVTQKQERPELPLCVVAPPPVGNLNMRDFLIKCWDPVASNRPTAMEVLKLLDNAIIMK